MDDEYQPGDEESFDMGQGVQEVLSLLAEGGKLPPDPRMVGKVPTSPENFRKTMRMSTAMYESRYLQRKEWKVTVEEMQEIEDKWAKHGGDTKIPVSIDDIKEPRPAPDWTPETQMQYDSFQWLTYRLHRSLGDTEHVDRLVNDLASAGLLNDDVKFRDATTQRLAGASHQGSHFWVSPASLSDSEWTIHADTTLSMPHPSWYADYLGMQLQPSLPWVGHGNAKGMQQASVLTAASAAALAGAAERASKYRPHEDQYWEEPAHSAAELSAKAAVQSDQHNIQAMSQPPRLADELLYRPASDTAFAQTVNGLLDVVLGKRLARRSEVPHCRAKDWEHADSQGVEELTGIKLEDTLDWEDPEMAHYVRLRDTGLINELARLYHQSPAGFEEQACLHLPLIAAGDYEGAEPDLLLQGSASNSTASEADHMSEASTLGNIHAGSSSAFPWRLRLPVQRPPMLQPGAVRAEGHETSTTRRAKQASIPGAQQPSLEVQPSPWRLDVPPVPGLERGHSPAFMLGFGTRPMQSSLRSRCRAQQQSISHQRMLTQQ
ncbi:hypothetical protein WJX73_000002 [Symbiochloris irregularis]|uniref:Uncharacterized protein n=1 Tax=Symbiochloris irregularis TaxID=706552 RepID=A0AAW1NHJ4_9CHLO